MRHSFGNRYAQRMPESVRSRNQDYALCNENDRITGSRGGFFICAVARKKILEMIFCGRFAHQIFENQWQWRYLCQFQRVDRAKKEMAGKRINSFFNGHSKIQNRFDEKGFILYGGSP